MKHYAGDGRSAHALRHTALTELAESSGDAFLEQELAGWASPATATHYVRRASTERLREAMAETKADSDASNMFDTSALTAQAVGPLPVRAEEQFGRTS